MEGEFFNVALPVIKTILRRTRNITSRSGEVACQATKETRALLKKHFGMQSIQRVYMVGKLICSLWIKIDGIYLANMDSTVHVPTHLSQDRLVELQETVASAKAVSVNIKEGSCKPRSHVVLSSYNSTLNFTHYSFALPQTVQPDPTLNSMIMMKIGMYAFHFYTCISMNKLYCHTGNFDD
ncbi:hypothetical protein BDA99DRAFT_538986 [Phascolomyces articulosus]|uniref:Uncharacterized protein n=1 Tax=Phascolomyces articulosus TaxID=60185 RepID=A0AAD5PCJ2_9FUNG|nr:hypothetical protein BDA99DRAFT_538986 [Phascolomyces articulosus]